MKEAKNMKLMKKSIAIVLLAAMIMTLCSGFAMATSYLYVKKSVHMRTGAGVSYKSIRVLSKGTKVTKLGSAHASNGDLWYKVKYNGKTGWINAGYLSKKNPDVTYVTAKKGSTHIRSEASLSGEDLGTFKKGASAEYLGETETDDRGVDWYKIKYKGIKGWVSEKYTVIDD